MPSRQETNAWEFTPALDFLNHLSAPKELRQDEAATTTTINGYHTPPIGTREVRGDASLGDFSRIWEFLGVPKDVAPPELSPPLQADLEELPEREEYTSDGALYKAPSTLKGVKWRDETHGDALADEKSSDELAATPLNKNQRKKRNRKLRKAEERDKAKAVSDMESEGELPLRTPARKASIHSLAAVATDVGGKRPELVSRKSKSPSATPSAANTPAPATPRPATPTKPDFSLKDAAVNAVQEALKKVQAAKPAPPSTKPQPVKATVSQGKKQDAPKKPPKSPKKQSAAPAVKQPAKQENASPELQRRASLPTQNAQANQALASNQLHEQLKGQWQTIHDYNQQLLMNPQLQYQALHTPTRVPQQYNGPPQQQTYFAPLPYMSINPAMFAGQHIPQQNLMTSPQFLPQGLQHGVPPVAPMVPPQSTQFAPKKTSNQKKIEPLIVRSGDDRHWALLLKLIKDFYEDRKYLVSPMQMSNNRTDPEGVHVFVDASNIFIGFMDQLKKARGIHPLARVPEVNISFQSLVLLMERRRPVARRVLAGSTPAPPAFEEARKVGYECNILDKVLKAKELTERQKFFQQRDAVWRHGKPKAPGSGPETAAAVAAVATAVGNGTPNTPSHHNGPSTPSTSGPVFAPEKLVEQAVDEILHLKILESVVDTDVNPANPPTMVLATGDAAEAEYSDGFMRMVERALKKGWKVELVSWSKSISQAYRRKAFRDMWGERFRIIELDDYAEELLDM